MPNAITEGDLARVRDWANAQLADGSEQPWSTFLLTKLGETIDALLAGMAATRAIDSRLAEGPPLRLVACNTSSHLPPQRAADEALRPGDGAVRVAEPVS